MTGRGKAPYPAAASEARNVLRELIYKLQQEESPYYKRYGEWIEREFPDDTLEIGLLDRLRAPVLEYLQLGNGSVNSLKNIGGNLNHEGWAVYLHGILGLDGRVRIYIGQTKNLSARVRQHWNFRYRRDNPSLHYHAVQHSVFDVFAVLVELPDLATGRTAFPGYLREAPPDLVLNILEMWCCLLFRTLPAPVLDEYEMLRAKPAMGVGSLDVGLNIASPLDQGSVDWWDVPDLGASDDPLVREWVEILRKKKMKSKAVPTVEDDAIAEKAGREETKADQRAVLVPQMLVEIARAVPLSTWFFAGTTAVLGLIVLRKRFGALFGLRAGGR